MKRFFSIPCAFLIFAIAATAQTAVEKEVSKANWQLFEPANEEFTIETPIALNAVKFDKTSRLHNGLVEGTYFFVFSFKENAKEYADARERLIVKFARANQLQPVAENVGSVLVKKFGFNDKDGFHHKIVFANTKNRRYIFQTTSLRSDNPLSDKFLATIKIDRNYIEEVIPAPETLAVEGGGSGRSASGTGTGIGGGSGSGSGSGTGSGSGSGSGSGAGEGSGTSATNVPRAPSQTTPVKLLSKPQARYTDLARTYNIAGTIRTRVTLLASGEVGAVTPLTRLPFGLLDSVLTAAKSIRFEPKQVNGVPVSTIVTIDYSFSIY